MSSATHGEICWDLSKPDGTPRKLLAAQRLNDLGWHAKISLIEGVRATYSGFSTIRATIDAESVDARRPWLTPVCHRNAWSGISVIGREVSRSVFTIVLAWLVGPDDFGIVAQAMVYFGIVGLLLDQGFSTGRPDP
jgi:hypothetical protein